MADLFRDVPGPRLPFAVRQVRAGPHENFHYILGDAATGDAAVVDPAFALEDLFARAGDDDLRVRTAFFTHAHWDHIGGIPAIADHGVREVVVHEVLAGHSKVEEARDAGMRARLVADGDVVPLGSVPITALHTPGHQPESTCYLAGQEGRPRALFGGDCLFIDSCGRTDFPGGDTDAMFASMARIRALQGEGDIVVLPGHDYADRPHEGLRRQVARNPALATTDRAAFDALPFLRG